MKKFIFTIIATIFFAVAAEAQTNSAAAYEVSLENATNIHYGKGTALTMKAANAYSQAINANNHKSFNVAVEAVATPYVINTKVPVKEIMNVLVQANTPCYIGNSITVAVF